MCYFFKTGFRYTFPQRIKLYIGGTHGATVIAVGTGYNLPNFNPEQDCLHFTKHNTLGNGMHQIILPTLTAEW